MVIGAASSPEMWEIARSLGADATVDYSDPIWSDQVRDLTGGRGVDVVVESLSGDVVPAALKTPATFGRMVVIGGASGKLSPFNFNDLIHQSRRINGFSMDPYFG
jgi:NADPH2:quinone reductase